MAPPQGVHDLVDDAWRASRYRGLALVALTASVACGPTALWQAFSGRAALHVLALAAAAAALGILTTERLGRPYWRQRRGLAYRLGEATVVLAAARVATWAFDVGWPTLRQMSAWLRAPSTFLDGPFLFVATVLMIVWGTAISATSDFLDLALQPDEIAAQQPHGYGDSLSYWRAARSLGRFDILARFARRWIWGGVALLALVGLSRVDMQSASTGLFRVGLRDLGLRPEVLGGLVAYFLSGLLLLSDARLAVLRGQWFNQRIGVAPPVMQRWRASTLLVVGLVALLALALPIGTTGWLTSALLWLLGLLVRIGMWLYVLLSLVLMWLLQPLLRLLQQETATELSSARPPSAIPTQAEITGHLPDWLGGTLVWGLVALVAGYLLWSFLQANGLLTGWSALMTRLRHSWRWRRWRLITAVRQRLAQRRPPTSRPPGGRLQGNVLRLRGLSPRERVRYFYLLALRRAAERGLVRPPHKTPQEFLRDLAAGWPEAEADAQALTEAFIAARYTAQTIEPQRMNAAHQVWRRVMRALRRPAGAEGPHVS